RCLHTKKEISIKSEQCSEEKHASPQTLSLHCWHTKKEISIKSEQCSEEKHASPQTLSLFAARHPLRFGP
ncbi:MAG: hypothetical protein R3359_13480, partial [Marinirhabdus sp.]|nr:hypothetical protein [Marinirhabdus sp.]